jgi:hypothetical protein
MVLMRPAMSHLTEKPVEDRLVVQLYALGEAR